MKHWMAIVIIGVMATGLSQANNKHQPDLVRTSGLPAGWIADGVIPGLDEIAVDRPRGGGRPELVIVQHEDAPDGRPLAVHQTIDATPWRGRTMIVSFYSHIYLEPEVMRRTKDRRVIELHAQCDGRQARRTVSVDAVWHTREWVEHNFPVKVPDDAARCTFGVASLVKSEIRLSRMHLKDNAVEREAWLAKWRPELPFPYEDASIFPASAGAPIAPPNLDFTQ